jgi:hypothetical protein
LGEDELCSGRLDDVRRSLAHTPAHIGKGWISQASAAVVVTPAKGSLRQRVRPIQKGVKALRFRPFPPVGGLVFGLLVGCSGLSSDGLVGAGAALDTGAPQVTGDAGVAPDATTAADAGVPAVRPAEDAPADESAPVADAGSAPEAMPPEAQRPDAAMADRTPPADVAAPFEPVVDVAPDVAPDLAAAADLAPEPPPPPPPDAAADLAAEVAPEVPAPSIDVAPARCPNIYGTYLFILGRLLQSGCPLGSCGYPGYRACGDMSLTIASEPAPGKIRWKIYAAGLLGDFIGDIDEAGHFTTVNEYFPNSTFVGNINAKCEVTDGVIQYLPGGICMAFWEYTGKPF